MARSLTRKTRFFLLFLVLAALALAPSAQATFPGANGRIAFIRGDDIYSMEPDGSAVRQLTTFADGVSTNFESWSPDGRQIVFTKRFPDVPPQLWVMAADGSRQRPLLAQADFANRAPRFSPDGRSIVFAHCRVDAPCAIWRMKADGTQARALTPFDPEVNDFHPGLSPNSAAITFTSSARDGVISGVYVMASDGSGIRLVTPPELEACCPDWAPGGRRLAFDSYGDPTLSPIHAAIWTVNQDGSQLRRLTRPGGRVDFDPSWSPRGNAIAFQRSSVDVSSSAVYVVKRNGRGLKKIQDDAQLPRWGARP
jgi:Tol biopolymer transport system component